MLINNLQALNIHIHGLKHSHGAYSFVTKSVVNYASRHLELAEGRSEIIRTTAFANLTHMLTSPSCRFAI
jgi:hypothetical protein